MLSKNIANQESTDIFRTDRGCNNIAPLKISGSYKLRVSKNGTLQIADYSGKVRDIETSLPILPQIANFLQTYSEVSHGTRYGAYQRGTEKTFHIPYYFSDDSPKPKYFVLSRVENVGLTQDSLYSGRVIHNVDLEACGIWKFFDEVNEISKLDYPLFFNWEQPEIRCNGYSIYTDSPKTYVMSLDYSRANQTFLDVTGNRILNAYKNAALFYPRFVNFEFEFEFEDNNTHHNNFYGYLADENKIDYPWYSEHCCIKNGIQFTQIVDKENPVTLNDYRVVMGTATIIPVSFSEPKAAFIVGLPRSGDTISVNFADEITEYKYTVKSSDMRNTLLETMKVVCSEATSESGNRFLFEVADTLLDNKVKIIITWNDIANFIDGCHINAPLNRYALIDSGMFYGLEYLTDLSTPSSDAFENSEIVQIGNEDYTIVKKFTYGEKQIIRLDSPHNLTESTYCKFFDERTEYLADLAPVPLLKYHTDLLCRLPYDQQAYMDQLHEKFVAGNDLSDEESAAYIANKAILNFAKKQVPAEPQYAAWENGDITVSDTVRESAAENIDTVLTMLFASGSTAFITPHLLNFAFEFYTNNGCLDPDILSSDPLRYNWLLIKGECPDYLLSDERSLRYFDDTPKLTSKLVPNGNGTCECVFLGVRYIFDQKWKNYQFAAALLPDNQLTSKVSYSFKLDYENNIILLQVSRYMDFVDLLRGGNSSNAPLIDLSFLHNAVTSLNTASNEIDTFETGGLWFAPPVEEYESFQFGLDFIGGDWKHYSESDNKWYVLVKREQLLVGNAITDLKAIMPESGDAQFYMYAEVDVDGQTQQYQSLTMKICGIKFVYEDYVWCEDVQFKFFNNFDDSPDTTIFVTLYEDQEKPVTVAVKRGDITNIEPDTLTDEIFDNIYKTATITVDGSPRNVTLIAPDSRLSLKEHYFSIDRSTYTKIDGSIGTNLETFTFPEFFRQDYAGRVDLFDKFDGNISASNAKIDLFSRNQLWNYLRNICRIDLKFKELYEAQVRKLINGITLPNFIDNTEQGGIISDKSGYINVSCSVPDTSGAIWKTDKAEIYDVKRLSGIYSPYMCVAGNVHDFQISRDNFGVSELYHIYSPNFGGDGISATGLWSEVQGNVVSSLFTKGDNIVFIPAIPATRINIKDAILSTIDIARCIVLHTNSEYISGIDQNVNNYIKTKYADYLLENFYTVSEAHNKSGNKLTFYSDKKDNDFVAADSEIYKLIFTRKK